MPGRAGRRQRLQDQRHTAAKHDRMSRSLLRCGESTTVLPSALETGHRVPVCLRGLVDLRHRWADETTYLVFEPLELIDRLTSLTPRPRINLLSYYSLAPADLRISACCSRWRGRCIFRAPFFLAGAVFFGVFF